MEVIKVEPGVASEVYSPSPVSDDRLMCVEDEEQEIKPDIDLIKMEPHSDSEASLVYLPNEDDHDIKKEECPLPAAFCDMRKMFCYGASIKEELKGDERTEKSQIYMCSMKLLNSEQDFLSEGASRLDVYVCNNKDHGKETDICSENDSLINNNSEKSFKRKLKRNSHSVVDVKRYKCEICGKYFAMRCDLKKHSRIHSGEKPFRCKICFKGFTHNGNLLAHRRTHTVVVRQAVAMEALISEVQERNALWNKRNPHYNDRVTIEKEWDSVAESTGYSKEDAKKKWRNLRDQFLKEFKKIPKSKSGDSQDCAATYRGKWQYFTNLLFLKDTVVPRDTEGNISLLEVSEDTQVSRIESEFNENEDSNAIVSVPQVSLNEILTPSHSQPTENPLSLSKATVLHPRRKRAREDNIEVEQRLLDIESKMLALLQTPEDENSLFLRSLLPYFKRMDPFQQLRVRTKFQDILLQEMSQGQSSSFQTSGTS